MVVAEACSVGTPVLITNKVNLFREILQYDAGFVDNDSQEGVDNLMKKWISEKYNPRNCMQLIVLKKSFIFTVLRKKLLILQLKDEGLITNEDQYFAGAFLPVPPIKGGAIEAVWFLLGQEFAKHGHEVTHISCILKT